jgi:hypothetical protein
VAYSIELAERIRKSLRSLNNLKIEEKKMFRGLAFLVNGKMCVNVSGEKLMCRYDPALKNEVSMRVGFEPMIMKGREYQGYCYVSKRGYESNADFEYWLTLCLNFNGKAKATKRRKPAAK